MQESIKELISEEGEIVKIWERATETDTSERKDYWTPLSGIMYDKQRHVLQEEPL